MIQSNPHSSTLFQLKVINQRIKKKNYPGATPPAVGYQTIYYFISPKTNVKMQKLLIQHVRACYGRHRHFNVENFISQKLFSDMPKKNPAQ